MEKQRIVMVFISVSVTCLLWLLVFAIYGDSIFVQETQSTLAVDVEIPNNNSLLMEVENRRDKVLAGLMRKAKIKAIRKTQVLRKKRVKESCDKFQTIYNNGVRDMRPWYENLRVLPEQKVVVCLIHKVGSTYWRSMEKRFEFRTLESYGNEDRLKIIRDFTTVMFVRHPFERLMSAYNDRVASMMPIFVDTYGKDIERFYPRGKENSCLGDIDFKTFIKYVVHRGYETRYFDSHWVPYYRRCRPCFVNYDVIGTLETFKDDMMLLDTLVDFNKNAERAMRSGLEVRSKCRPMNLEFSKYNRLPCRDNEMILRAKITGLVGKGYLDPDEVAPMKANAKSEWKEQCLSLVESFKTPEQKALVRQRKKEATRRAFKSLPLKLFAELKYLYRLDLRMFGYNAEDLLN